MDRVGLVPVTTAAFGVGLYAIHPTDMAEHLYTYWDRYFAPKWQDQIEDLFSPPETFFFDSIMMRLRYRTIQATFSWKSRLATLREIL